MGVAGWSQLPTQGTQLTGNLPIRGSYIKHPSWRWCWLHPWWRRGWRSWGGKSPCSPTRPFHLPPSLPPSPTHPHSTPVNTQHCCVFSHPSCLCSSHLWQQLLIYLKVIIHCVFVLVVPPLIFLIRADIVIIVSTNDLSLSIYLVEITNRCLYILQIKNPCVMVYLSFYVRNYYSILAFIGSAYI